MRKRGCASAVLLDPEPFFPKDRPFSSKIKQKQGPKVLSSFPKKIGQTILLFVHRTCILLRCGKPLAADALLGCFLPRLGPLVATQAASFLIYFPLSLFAADLSFGCGCLLASRAGPIRPVFARV